MLQTGKRFEELVVGYKEERMRVSWGEERQLKGQEKLKVGVIGKLKDSFETR